MIFMTSLIDDFPNPEQCAIIRSVLCRENRLTVVRACPGSGKTRLFSKILNDIVSTWTAKRAGVAALSFTNVAHEAITENLGEQLSYPHYIGTLDSFMLRYIVKPFGHVAGLTLDGPRLIPSPIDEIIENPKVKIGPNQEDRRSIFKMRFVDEGENGPNMAIKNELSHRYERINNKYVYAILTKKKKEWAKNGRITHSDCQYLSSKILKDKDYSDSILKIIVRRFPVILIDEFQDTGWFLGSAIVQMLRCSHVSGLVVGDPDQAIFEFGGAKPTLFENVEKLPGTKTYPLTRTQRCPKRIAAVASELSDSRSSILARDDAKEGRAIMLVHGMEKIRLDDLIAKEIGNLAQGSDSRAILARRGSTVKKLTGLETTEEFKGRSRYCRQIDRAVLELRDGNSQHASRIISRILGDLVIGEETPNAKILWDNNIDIKNWRLAIYKVIKAAATSDTEDETWNAWRSRVKNSVRIAAQDIGWVEDKAKLGAKFRMSEKDGELKRSLKIKIDKNICYGENEIITTIHQVKGEGFDFVVLFIPKPHARISPCPSLEWWNPSTREERRVAFVATSRTKNIFVLCIHLETYDALKTKCPQFVELFELKNLSGKVIPNQSSLSSFL